MYVYCYIPSNVAENGLLRCHALYKATEYDSILCAEVADIDLDGQNELILGTFGKVSDVTSTCYSYVCIL